MNIVLVKKNGVDTMSSRDIASLTGKEHKKVMRDIRRTMAEAGEYIRAEDYVASNGKSNPEYHLNYSQTILLLTGYSVALRARVIREWEALKEAKAQPIDISALQTKDGVVALLHAIQDRDVLLEAAQPAIEFTETVTEDSNSYDMAITAKMLGMGPRLFIDALRELYILMEAKEGRAVLPMQRYIDRGYFEVAHKVRTTQGVQIPYVQTMITGFGRVYLHGKLQDKGYIPSKPKMNGFRM